MRRAFFITKKELLDATGVALLIANILTGAQGYRFGAHQGQIINQHFADRAGKSPLMTAPLVGLDAIFDRAADVADNMCRLWNTGSVEFCGKAAIPNGKMEFSNVEMTLFYTQMTAEALTIMATAPGTVIGSMAGYITANPQ